MGARRAGPKATWLSSSRARAEAVSLGSLMVWRMFPLRKREGRGLPWGKGFSFHPVRKKVGIGPLSSLKVLLGPYNSVTLRRKLSRLWCPHPTSHLESGTQSEMGLGIGSLPRFGGPCPHSPNSCGQELSCPGARGLEGEGKPPPQPQPQRLRREMKAWRVPFESAGRPRWALIA